MKYERTVVKPAKLNPSKELRASHDQEREKLRAERKIANMNTGAILGFVAHRHRFAMSIAANVVLVGFIATKLVF